MKQLILILSITITVNISYSQLNYDAANGVVAVATYTDLGTNGTVIATPGFDDDNSEAQNIGFNFVYNGTTFTQFVLNTNGAIKLGSSAPADPALYSSLFSTETNLIYPLSYDLFQGTNPEYRVYTSGIAPDRVCTIQFKNVSDWFTAPATASQFSDMDFQIKLYETSNNIEFVYGSFVAGGAEEALTPVEVGIKGPDASSSVNVTKSSIVPWDSATFINGEYTGNAHNTRNTVLPVPGTTYRFIYAMRPPNDALVSTIYTLGKIPIGYSSPQVVSTIIKNAGSGPIANLNVILNVTGANSFTDSQIVASIAPGSSATVSFTGYSSTVIGTNTVTVSVAADDNNTNNSSSVNQAVTAGTFSYADSLPSSNSIGYINGEGLFVNKYTLSGFAFVDSVNFYISDEVSNTGNTIYAVVLDPAGTIIGQSANYAIVQGDLGAYKSLPILIPPSLTAGDFFVGIAQSANVTTAYFPLGIQNEDPVRAGAFYTAPIAGGVAPAENTDLGRFMIEAVVSTTPLPVKLSSFSGRIQNNTTFLNWLTSYESNTDRFEVEKSPAGSGNWLKIGTVAAVGNAASSGKYQFVDAGLSNGNWMYRLKIFDKDGKFAYSPVIILKLTGKSLFVLEQNYPNPVTGVTMIRYELGKDANVAIELYGMDGKRIMAQQKGKQTKGSYNVPIDVKYLALSTGKYLYRLVVKDDVTGEISSIKKEMIVIRQ